jgi:hypothetical protein
MRRGGWAPVAAQLAVPVALGALIGGVLAYQAGSGNNAVHPVPLGAVPSPTPSWVNPAASTATASAASTTTPAASTTTSAATATAHGDGGVVAPANLLSARGLATVCQLTSLYQLTSAMTPAEAGCTSATR